MLRLSEDNNINLESFLCYGFGTKYKLCLRISVSEDNYRAHLVFGKFRKNALLISKTISILQKPPENRTSDQFLSRSSTS